MKEIFQRRICERKFSEGKVFLLIIAYFQNDFESYCKNIFERKEFNIAKVEALRFRMSWIVP